MRLLEGNAALVIGGGRGIGKAIALMLARNGADIAICGRARSEMKQTAKDIENIGQECMMIEADIRNYKEVVRIYTQFTKKFGAVDLLFNNAGVLTYDNFEENTKEQIDAMLEVNLRGMIYSTSECLRHMEEGGIIINTASLAGLRGYPQLAVYSATKFAVIGFTQALAEELVERGIKVFAVCPGATQTRMWDQISPGTRADFSASEVAEEVLLMLKNENLKSGTAVIVKHHKR
jgi:meso-butanediol dehydrogenase/(S,S)-butanediol dehydrogenase/diacetyl reductase